MAVPLAQSPDTTYERMGRACASAKITEKYLEVHILKLRQSRKFKAHETETNARRSGGPTYRPTRVRANSVHDPRLHQSAADA